VRYLWSIINIRKCQKPVTEVFTRNVCKAMEGGRSLKPGGEAVHELNSSDRRDRETTWHRFQQYCLVCALVFITGVWLTAAVLYGFAAATTEGLSRALMPPSRECCPHSAGSFRAGKYKFGGSDRVYVDFDYVDYRYLIALNVGVFPALSPTTGAPGLLQLFDWAPSRTEYSTQKVYQLSLLSFLGSCLSMSVTPG